MRTAKLGIVSFAILALVAVGAWAADSTPDEKSLETTAHTAVYKVKGLDKGLAKDLMHRLTKVKGVLSAKPDTEAGRLAVTFEPTKTGPEKILETMRKIAPKVALGKVGPADASHTKKDCGKCPHHKTCAKKKTD